MLNTTETYTKSCRVVIRFQFETCWIVNMQIITRKYYQTQIVRIAN